jgi:hypothetical protein
LTSNGWQPSIAGLLRHSEGSDIDKRARAVVEILRGAKTLVNDYKDTLSAEQRRAALSVIEAFERAQRETEQK